MNYRQQFAEAHAEADALAALAPTPEAAYDAHLGRMRAFDVQIEPSLVGLLSPDQRAEFFQWVREEWEYDSSAPLTTDEMCAVWLLDNWQRVMSWWPRVDVGSTEWFGFQEPI